MLLSQSNLKKRVTEQYNNLNTINTQNYLSFTNGDTSRIPFCEVWIPDYNLMIRCVAYIMCYILSEYCLYDQDNDYYILYTYIYI